MAESSAVSTTPRGDSNAIKELQVSMFDMNKLSIVCREPSITNTTLARGE
jgi:hypothetical protein